MAIPCTLTGIHPRSSELIRVSRDHDRARADASALERGIAADYARLEERQAKLGFAPAADGLLRWQDLFRPFSENVKGMRHGTLTRWFENNTFFRQPVVENDLQTDGSFISNYLLHQPGKPFKAVLPGPYTFAVSAEDRHYHGLGKLLPAIAEILAATCRNLPAACQAVQFNEPAIAYNAARNLLRPADWEAIMAGYAILLGGIKAKAYVHTYFGDFAAFASQIMELPVDGFGIDLTETDAQSLASLAGKEAILGLADARNSLVETADNLASRAATALEKIGSKRFYLAPNCDLEFLPLSIAEQKMEALSKAARILEANHG
ncbi:MAG: hypothetical protein HY519_00855 [Candidatus Aenigmarchaeota archaeon]|nr:hypothetical protein [Candidatus Aenigmarchaeota archaeon]